MADWTNPITWGATPITVDLLNEQIRDNTEHLKDPPTDDYSPVHGWTALTINSTSFAAMTNFSCSIDTYGGDILISFYGYLNSVSSSVFFDVTVNGQRLGGNEGIAGHARDGNVSLVWLLTDKAADSYTINLVAKVTSGSAVFTSEAPPQFWAREVS